MPDWHGTVRQVGYRQHEIAQAPIQLGYPHVIGSDLLRHALHFRDQRRSILTRALPLGDLFACRVARCLEPLCCRDDLTPLAVQRAKSGKIDLRAAVLRHLLEQVEMFTEIAEVMHVCRKDTVKQVRDKAAEALLDLVDLIRLIHGECWVVEDFLPGCLWSPLRRGRESRRRGLHSIGVTIAARTRHSQSTAGSQLIQGAISAVLGEVTSFGLGDRVQIHLHTDCADGLNSRSASGGCGLLQIHVIHTHADGQGDQHADESKDSAHNIPIVPP